MTIPEPDWKRFREIRVNALERFAGRVLDEGRAICDDESKTAHERYLDLYELMQKRDRQLANMFDDPRRSTAVDCLRLMHAHGLLEQDELSQLSPETRARLEI